MKQKTFQIKPKYFNKIDDHIKPKSHRTNASVKNGLRCVCNSFAACFPSILCDDRAMLRSHVTTVITPSTNSTVTASNGTNVTDPTLAQIQSQLTTVINNGNFSSAIGAAVGSNVISTVSTYYPISVEVGEEESGIGLTVGLALASIVLVVAGGLFFLHIFRRRSKISDIPVSMDESMYDKEGNNNVVISSENRDVVRIQSQDKNAMQFEKEEMPEEKFD